MPAKALTKEEVVLRANSVHNNKYDYSDSVYKNMSTKMDIRCPDHGVFSQVPQSHLNGRGCRLCHSSKIKKSDIEFFNGLKVLYPETHYDYTNVKYSGMEYNINMCCREHGEYEVKAKSALYKSGGCPICLARASDKRASEFFSECGKVHGNKYDYSDCTFTNVKSRLTLTCPYHTKFNVIAKKHLNGSGCKMCAMYGERSPQEWFLEEASDKYGDLYAYPDTVVVDKNTPVLITCKIHGTFKKTPYKFLYGYGCNECNFDKQRKTTEDFLPICDRVHHNKYNYDGTEYLSAKKKVDILCPEHGVFQQLLYEHSIGKGCPSCSQNLSKAEIEILDFISSLGFKVEQSNRTLIKPLELDIVIPEKKITIEYNGVRWHSEDFGKDKHYHKNKTTLCKDVGYRLIHIWEDDFISNPERELSFIKHALGCSDNKKIYARKTALKEIPNLDGREFLDEHHVQGSCSATRHIGLFNDDELVSVTAFTHNGDRVELTRHATKHNVIGSLGKTTKYYSKQYKTDIVSFCDLARFSGESYYKAGYELDKEIPPDYKYVVGNKREHKFNWRKKNIASKLPEIYDESLTEKQMMDLAQISRIWDCGKLRLVYKYNN